MLFNEVGALLGGREYLGTGPCVGRSCKFKRKEVVIIQDTGSTIIIEGFIVGY